MKTIMKTTVETTVRRTSEIGARELIEKLGLPPDTILYVNVPGGADWSNCALVIDNLTPLIAESTAHSIEESEA